MYPTDLKNGIKLNPFVANHNIMLKTIQNLCYNKVNVNTFNMTSPFLVDNILHQQKTVNFHNQFINQQLETYMQRQSVSRENTPDGDEAKTAEQDDENRTDEIEKLDDEDSKSRDDDFNAKNDAAFYNHDIYQRNDDRCDKEVLNIPNLARRCHCGSFDCPPFACKKSGIRRLEELEKRFNLHSYQESSGYQENSGDEGEKEKYSTDDMVRSCEEFNNEQKKPLLKFSVSAILGEERDPAKNVNGMYFTNVLINLYK